jgi:chemotaxis protein CheZ
MNDTNNKRRLASTPANGYLTEVGRELQTVIGATAAAADIIMDCAEIVMQAKGLDAASYRRLVEEQMLRIFESCSFQDLTGQRLARVITTLDQLENDRDHVAERRRRLLLHGPQSEAHANGQADIDRLFAAGAHAS